MNKTKPVPKKMKAVVLHGVGDLRYQSVPVPVPKQDEVLVRVSCCGVCGSDIPRIFEKGTYSFPMICGHEFMGVIAALGEEVRGCEIGTPVVVFPLIWCGRCPACEQGKYVQCSDYNYLGSRCDGAFAEYVAVPARNVVPLPSEVSFQEAAMTEPAAVALHAVRRGGGTSAGELSVVFGAGPIGLMVAQWLHILGCSQIVLFDIQPEKIEFAERHGFLHVFNSLEQNPVEVIARLSDGQGADLAIDAAGVPASLTQAMEVTRRGGRVVMLGNPSAEVTLPASLLSQLMRREVTLLGTWNSEYSTCGNHDDWKDVLNALSEERLILDSIVSHYVPLEKAIKTLKMMRDRSEFFSKVLIRP